MFGLLKSKLAGFINGLTGREEKKEPASAAAAPPAEEKPVQQPSPETREQPKPAVREEKEIVSPKAEPVKEAPKPEVRVEREPATPKTEPIKQTAPTAIHTHQIAKQEAAPTHIPALPAAKPGVKQLEKKIEAKPARAEMKAEAPQQPAPDLKRLGELASSEKRGMAPKIGLGTAIRSFFSNEITIGESEVADLVEELELSLLEADVEYGVSMEVASQLKGRLVGMKVPKGKVAEKTRETIAQVLESVMDSERKFDFMKRVQELPKPVKILFVGPNGAGKTTTMAKMARMLMEAGITPVFSASDTFRAAAIEQTEVHGSRLGVKVIKSKYGADPASVAFDAVNFASSHGLGAVLIDSAGRQDTNANLLSELKKISRVAKPDIKLYVGESIGGNSLLDQIKAFNEAIGIDGAILTKLDCDAKGGTAISIAKATGIPILFLGVGQRYEDLIPFDPHRIAQEIMS